LRKKKYISPSVTSNIISELLYHIIHSLHLSLISLYSSNHIINSLLNSSRLLTWLRALLRLHLYDVYGLHWLRGLHWLHWLHGLLGLHWLRTLYSLLHDVYGYLFANFFKQRLLKLLWFIVRVGKFHHHSFLLSC
jgi:hypothetical protein